MHASRTKRSFILIVYILFAKIKVSLSIWDARQCSDMSFGLVGIFGWLELAWRNVSASAISATK